MKDGCRLCVELTAVVYCLECNAKLCQSHSNSHSTSGHKMLVLNESNEVEIIEIETESVQSELKFAKNGSLLVEAFEVATEEVIELSDAIDAHEMEVDWVEQENASEEQEEEVEIQPDECLRAQFAEFNASKASALPLEAVQPLTCNHSEEVANDKTLYCLDCSSCYCLDCLHQHSACLHHGSRQEMVLVVINDFKKTLIPATQEKLMKLVLIGKKNTNQKETKKKCFQNLKEELKVANDQEIKQIKLKHQTELKKSLEEQEKEMEKLEMKEKELDDTVEKFNIELVQKIKSCKEAIDSFNNTKNLDVLDFLVMKKELEGKIHEIQVDDLHLIQSSDDENNSSTDIRETDKFNAEYKRKVDDDEDYNVDEDYKNAKDTLKKKRSRKSVNAANSPMIKLTRGNITILNSPIAIKKTKTQKEEVDQAVKAETEAEPRGEPEVETENGPKLSYDPCQGLKVNRKTQKLFLDFKFNQQSCPKLDFDFNIWCDDCEKAIQFDHTTKSGEHKPKGYYISTDDSVTTKIMNDPIDEDKEVVDVNESENEDIQECKVQVEGKVKSGCKHAFKWIHEEGQEQVLYYTVDGKECEVVIPYLLEQQL